MSDEQDQELERRVRRAYRSGPALGAAARARLLETIHAAPPPARPWFRFAAPDRRARWVLTLAGAGALIFALVTVPALDRAQKSDRARAASDPASEHSADRAGDEPQLVSFQIQAAGAERVALVGDFNGWDPQAAPMERTGTTDTWALTVAVPRGRHVYAFLVNGRQWLADPAAPLAPADGFGVPNSVLIVGGLASS